MYWLGLQAQLTLEVGSGKLEAAEMAAVAFRMGSGPADFRHLQWGMVGLVACVNMHLQNSMLFKCSVFLHSSAVKCMLS